MSVQLTRRLAMLGILMTLLVVAFRVPDGIDVTITPEISVAPLVQITTIPESSVAPLIQVIVIPQSSVAPLVQITVTPELSIAPLVQLTNTPILTVAPAVALTPEVGVTLIQEGILTVKSTAYNSLEAQTDSTPNITAIGSQTRFGIIAVSRDLLGHDLPYGSLVRLKDLGNYHNGREVNKYQTMLDSQDIFIVEDTMHARKTNQIDVWFQDHSAALEWGVRQIEVEVVRYGWDGPEIMADSGSSADISMQ